MVAWVNAVMLIGTFAAFSSRREAVTTISSRPLGALSAAPDLASSAYATVPNNAGSMAACKSRPRENRFEVLIVPNPLRE